MGRWLNDIEHGTSLKRTAAGNLAFYNHQCKCAVKLHDIQILGRSKDKLTHEISEAMIIDESEPSFVHTNNQSGNQ